MGLGGGGDEVHVFFFLIGLTALPICRLNKPEQAWISANNLYSLGVTVWAPLRPPNVSNMPYFVFPPVMLEP